MKKIILIILALLLMFLIYLAKIQVHADNREKVTDWVYKIRDGKVTCYILDDDLLGLHQYKGISCLQTK